MVLIVLKCHWFCYSKAEEILLWCNSLADVIHLRISLCPDTCCPFLAGRAVQFVLFSILRFGTRCPLQASISCPISWGFKKLIGEEQTTSFPITTCYCHLHKTAGTSAACVELLLWVVFPWGSLEEGGKASTYLKDSQKRSGSSFSVWCVGFLVGRSAICLFWKACSIALFALFPKTVPPSILLLSFSFFHSDQLKTNCCVN